MQLFPLQHILFWIAITLSPQGTSEIIVKGPDKTWTWTMQESGWIHAVDQSTWAAQGSTVTSTAGDKVDKQEVKYFIKGIKEHDWEKSSSLKLGPHLSLTKHGDTFVYTVDEEETSEKQFVISFKKK